MVTESGIAVVATFLGFLGLTVSASVVGRLIALRGDTLPDRRTAQELSRSSSCAARPNESMDTAIDRPDGARASTALHSHRGAAWPVELNAYLALDSATNSV